MKRPALKDINLIREELDNRSILSNDEFNTTFITNINDYFGKNFSFVRRRHSFIKKRPSGNSSSRSLITSLTS